ncbi:dihydroneopterin aldolase [Auraticoccus sp. F435]|uniref:7,8-dihydroneopterin aldolase n=1 Tax=Auraticoccus cholistanensis TaxID=2656650 RepID=A0A6A9UYQ9_9ACTN|nr:dihydroneopterin aldolase [Auraticoccus cholistanensis]MVA76984.1 dihydroneopterin aldolase [Auraticoccus cholistanensis]
MQPEHGQAVDEPDRVTVRGIRGYGRHGVHDFEREVGQPFLVDLTCWLDSTRAAREDDLEATVHYGILSQRVLADIEGEPLQLIESLAERVATTALSFAPVTRVEVTVHKPQAPVGVPVDDVSVTLTRSKPS